MIYHVRYKTPGNAAKALDAYNRNAVEASQEGFRDLRVVVKDIKQERMSVRIDTKYKGYTYTPYDKNSEW